ncbi:uncharacterized [Tachysurus ichikawai]
MSAKRSQQNTGHYTERTTGDRGVIKSQSTPKHRTEKMISPANPKNKADKAATQAKPKFKVNEVSHIQSSQLPGSGSDVIVPPSDTVDIVIAPPPDFADDSDTPLPLFMDDVIASLPADIIVPPPDEFADEVDILLPNMSAVIPESLYPCPEKPADDAGMLIP